MGVGLNTFIHVIRFDRRYRTGSIVLLHHTVTYDNDFVQHLGVFTQVNTHCRSSRQLLGLITHIGDCQLRAGLYGKREITIEIGDCTIGRSYFKNGRTNNRFTIRLIYNRTLHGQLRKCSYSAHQEHQRDGKCTKHIQILFHCIK